MKIKLNNYNNGFKVVSLSLDETTKEDLSRENVSQIFVKEDRVVLLPDQIEVEISEENLDTLKCQNNYDVFELWEDGHLYKQYDSSSMDTVFFITGMCNSNCVMCPSSDESRKKQSIANINTMIEVASHIPSDVPHVTITGGEPFMVGEDIFRLIGFIKEKFLSTELLILTNGRIFALTKYVDVLASNVPTKCMLGIPLHGSNEIKHDAITQTKNSFVQTITGVKKLLSKNICVELRIVVSKLNIEDIIDIAKLIIREMSTVDHVSIMAMEMTGSAHRNRDLVWMPYSELFKNVADAAELLISNGITVRLYNFPLCTVEKKYWGLCEKSISPEKVRYGDFCDNCDFKAACGGVFAGSYRLESNDLGFK